MTDGAAETKAKKPFYESNLFRATVAVVGLLGTLWAFVGLPTPTHVVKEITANELPLHNVEIVLDASSRMGSRFGNATKLEVAAEAVDQYVAADDNVGLALRRAGGSCGQEAEPLVNFDDGQTREVAAAAKEQAPSGRSNWALAVRAAINDFSGTSFHRPGAENQVVLFVGGGDQCGGLVGQEIRNELQHANVHAQFRVYALKVPKKEQKRFENFKRQLAGVAPVEVHNANSVKQLYRAVAEEGGGEGGARSGGGGGGAEQGGRPVEAGGAASESLATPSQEGFFFEEEESEEANPEELEQAEKEREEKEKAETEEAEEAEEEVELETAKEAPDTIVEPDGEGGETEAGLGESKTAPAPEPSPGGAEGKRPSSRGLVRPMTPSWTTRPNDRPCRASLRSCHSGSSARFWLSMPWSPSERLAANR
ncbi:MAG TPA: vWA domain-containing protein [Solirubrobacterales bacterium]|nr:vWA domain-containing protein [Solirubrobacterales bacterium]